jgi:hypothetical protein
MPSNPAIVKTELRLSPGDGFEDCTSAPFGL